MFRIERNLQKIILRSYISHFSASPQADDSAANFLFQKQKLYVDKNFLHQPSKF